MNFLRYLWLYWSRPTVGNLTAQLSEITKTTVRQIDEFEVPVEWSYEALDGLTKDTDSIEAYYNRIYDALLEPVKPINDFMHGNAVAIALLSRQDWELFTSKVKEMTGGLNRQLRDKVQDELYGLSMAATARAQRDPAFLSTLVKSGLAEVQPAEDDEIQN